MICQKCGTLVPDGKIYCEKCGSAIQMVPDYNPEEDFTIGSDERKTEEENQAAKQPWWYRYRYGILGVCLVLLEGTA